MRARKKVLASFEAGMNSPKLAVTRKHYVIERQADSGNCFAFAKAFIESWPKSRPLRFIFQ